MRVEPIGRSVQHVRLERVRHRIDDPAMRHAVPRVQRQLGDSIDPHGRRRDDLHDERRCSLDAVLGEDRQTLGRDEVVPLHFADGDAAW